MNTYMTTTEYKKLEIDFEGRGYKRDISTRGSHAFYKTIETGTDSYGVKRNVCVVRYTIYDYRKHKDGRSGIPDFGIEQKVVVSRDPNDLIEMEVENDITINRLEEIAKEFYKFVNTQLP